MNQELLSTQKECFRFLSLSDFHLGNRRTNLDKTIQNVKRLVFPLLKDIDILFIPGDFFHTLLSLDNRVSMAAIYLMKEIDNLSMKYGFIVRIVRGTFLHDRNQNDFWNLFSSDRDHIKVFNTISFESVMGLNIIYIPDGSPKNSMSIIRGMLKDRCLKKVDLVIGHGEFEHTLGYGEIPHDTVFRASDFADIVDGCIIFGHRHTYNVYKNVIFGGAFERTRHGEEEDKGFVTIDYDKLGKKVQHQFHVNGYTNLYKSVDFCHLRTPEILIEKYIDLAESLISRSNDLIYIQVNINDPVLKASLQELNKNRYPTVVLSFKKTESTKTINTLTSISTLELITEDNIYDLIYESIGKKLSVEEIKTLINNC